ncbi:thioredoxin [Fuerstiella marisgermanici]|uniref:Thioredoxin n=1 Tax=Fuerstiella marisgermanici TaxID=1891926 RepID=A0A1P8WAD8_9PLAN|nr:thioredoxin [Fuerstiella marisgermanici]APZ91027.1 Thioredoxin-like protein [Fuerstiella marisgermanici]
MTHIFNRLTAVVGLSTMALLSGCVDSEVNSVSEVATGEPEPSEPEHYYINVDESNFEEVVVNAGKPVLVDFWAPWCGPCRMIAPSVEEIAADYKDRAVVVKINVDEAPELAQRYEATSIPLLVYLRDGEKVDQLVGAVPKDQIEAKLAALVSDGAPAE